MKKRFLLYPIFVLPVAVLTWFIIDRVDPHTGFYDGSPVLLILGLASVIVTLFLSFSLRSTAVRRGVPFSSPEHGVAWKLINILFAMLIMLNILCRFTFFRPSASYMLPLWAVSVAFECVAMICIYLRIISKPNDDPLHSVFLTLGPCLFFTADLLNRFFCSSVNRNNVPLMISFLSCGSLAVTALRMMQTLSSEEPSSQRQFLLSAFCSLVFCLGFRLPSVLFYLRTGNQYEIVCLVADCMASVVLYQEAYLTIPGSNT
ncbi:MAG: hypothetical protein J5744_03645 [Oscillospiraceae bacterium]|nr:hypothetical protein [Oscillospiraceae bacterium]